MKWVILALSAFAVTNCLDNGLVLTPPMGWLSWERFRCTVDCKNYPDSCINAKLFETMADHVAADGYASAGYNFIIIDDCWLASTRDERGRLQPDHERFPKGIRALADYIHSKALKFGIYEDVGPLTCAGYPGSEYHFQMDAQTFADWGVDYLKFDGCNYCENQYKFGYPPMAFYLNMTGRHIVLSCEYALYSSKKNYTEIAKACNLGRNFDDIEDSWESVKKTIEFYKANAGDFASVARPGYFNDPDMLIIGNFGLSHDQEQVQMAIWCILAAPLIMSNDLRNIKPESKEILLNKLAISVNQDPLGVQGRKLYSLGNIDIWSKPLTSPKGSFAFAIVNMESSAMPLKVTVGISSSCKGWEFNGFENAPKGFNITDIFRNKSMGYYDAKDNITVVVNPTGVFFGIATAV